MFKFFVLKVKGFDMPQNVIITACKCYFISNNNNSNNNNLIIIIMIIIIVYNKLDLPLITESRY